MSLVRSAPIRSKLARTSRRSLIAAFGETATFPFDLRTLCLSRDPAAGIEPAVEGASLLVRAMYHARRTAFVTCFALLLLLVGCGGKHRDEKVFDLVTKYRMLEQAATRVESSAPPGSKPVTFHMRDEQWTVAEEIETRTGRKAADVIADPLYAAGER